MKDLLILIVCFNLLSNFVINLDKPTKEYMMDNKQNIESIIINEDVIIKENEDKEEENQEEVITFETYFVPQNRGFKSYMDYRSITSTSSKQYKLQKLYAVNGDYGIRTVNGRYCIALGSHFTSNIGQYIDLVLANGTIIPCILADQKADIHTDKNNIVTLHNGCVSEFIVDTQCLDELAKKMGNISYCKNEWKSTVNKVIVYDKNVFDE